MSPTKLKQRIFWQRELRRHEVALHVGFFDCWWNGILVSTAEETEKSCREIIGALRAKLERDIA